MQHSTTCLANAVISAVQNLRDDETMTDFDFRIAMQDNRALALADEYLADYSPAWDICRCGENTMKHLFELAKSDADEADRLAKAHLANNTLSTTQYVALAGMVDRWRRDERAGLHHEV